MPHTPTGEELRALAGQLRPAQLLVLPFYHELKNEIKHPDRGRVQTEYFWRQWAPGSAACSNSTCGPRMPTAA